MIDETFQHTDLYELSLLETIDHALNRGLVIAGDITISVADIDLIFIGLNLLVGSVETINRVLASREDAEKVAPREDSDSNAAKI